MNKEEISLEKDLGGKISLFFVQPAAEGCVGSSGKERQIAFCGRNVEIKVAERPNPAHPSEGRAYLDMCALGGYTIRNGVAFALKIFFLRILLG